MEQVGKRYESGEYYLAELIISAHIFSSAVGPLDSALTAGCEAKKLGTVVIGTVKGDIHDIGKNIVATLLNCNGFKVIDLGVDVEVSTFVDAVKASKPQVVGMGCLLTTSFRAMKAAVAAVRATDPSVTILIGGGPIDGTVCKYVGADDYCKNAYAAVAAAKKAVAAR